MDPLYLMGFFRFQFFDLENSFPPTILILSLFTFFLFPLFFSASTSHVFLRIQCVNIYSVSNAHEVTLKDLDIILVD